MKFYKNIEGSKIRCINPNTNPKLFSQTENSKQWVSITLDELHNLDVDNGISRIKAIDREILEMNNKFQELSQELIKSMFGHQILNLEEKKKEYICLYNKIQALN